MHDTEKENNSAIIDFFLCLALLYRLYGYITNYTRNIPHVNLVGLQPIYLPHLLLLSHISPSVSPLPPSPSRSIFVIPTLSADTHRLRFGALSVALYVILSISISRPRSHSAIPLAPSDLGRSQPAN